MTVSHTGPDGEREAPWGTGQDNDPAEEPMDLTEEVTQLQLEDDDPPLPWLQGDDDDDLVIQSESSRLYTRLRDAGNPAALRIVDGGHVWPVWRGLLPAALKYTLGCVH